MSYFLIVSDLRFLESEKLWIDFSKDRFDFSWVVEKSSKECVPKKKKRKKKLEVILWFIDFFKAFDSIHGEKMEQILLAYGLLKETVTAIMMLNKKRKQCFHHSMVIDFFDIVPEALPRDTLAISTLNLPRLRTKNINRSYERKHS